MEFPKTIVILAYQRSGTTALRRILERTNSFINYGEIFAPKRTKENLGAYNFYLKLLLKNNHLIYPTFHNRLEILDKYFSELNLRAEGKMTLVDVKYDVLFNFHTFFYRNDIMPFFLKFCQMRQIKIIHLKRNNVLELALSYLIARERKKYHFSDSEDMENNICINVDDLVLEMDNYKFLNDQVKKYLELIDIQNVLQLEYEKIFHGNKLHIDAHREIENFTKLKGMINVETKLRKKTNTNLDIVANREEVISTINNIPEYQKYLIN